MNSFIKKVTWLVLGFIASAWYVRAEITLPSFISSNMVIQSGMPVPIWGQAVAGERITVVFRNQKKTTAAGKSGYWKVMLDPMKPSGTSSVMTVSGTNTIKIENVLVGEVWVCSGQSNMEFPLAKGASWRTGVYNYDEEVAKANYPEIRLFIVKSNKADSPLSGCQGEWKVCTPENIRDFSAVGYYFARYLNSRIHRPVGMIESAVGGTHAELWTRMEIMANNPLYAAVFEEYHQDLKKYMDYKIALSQWNKKLKEGAKDSSVTAAPPLKVKEPWRPACLWNAMVQPLIPYAIKGVIWYQGESNDGRASAYSQVFANLIASWRKEWKQGDFPFYFVQIAAEKDKTPILRDAQTQVWKTVNNTGMAVAIDEGDSANIHPRNKALIGERLAYWALAKDYGFKDVAFSGPLYKSMKISGNSLQLFFDFAEKGLLAKGDHLREFYVAGADKQFYPAKAVISGNTVIVSSEKVETPLYARYAWKNYMHPNLYNQQGLPAIPFKTDK